MRHGRTANQKLQDREADQRHFGGRSRARREAMVVAFHAISKEGYASGGESMIDKVN
jgi:hypothetical protein